MWALNAAAATASAVEAAVASAGRRSRRPLRHFDSGRTSRDDEIRRGRVREVISDVQRSADACVRVGGIRVGRRSAATGDERLDVPGAAWSGGQQHAEIARKPIQLEKNIE